LRIGKELKTVEGIEDREMKKEREGNVERKWKEDKDIIGTRIGNGTRKGIGQ
jgi:hypothetical protein